MTSADQEFLVTASAVRKALITIASPQPGRRWLLVRRHRRTGELAFYRCYAPRLVSLPVLVKVACTRLRIEECFQSDKNEAAFDHYQVRLYPAWYRYMTLAMLALAFLSLTS